MLNKFPISLWALQGSTNVWENPERTRKKNGHFFETSEDSHKLLTWVASLCFCPNLCCCGEPAPASPQLNPRPLRGSEILAMGKILVSVPGQWQVKNLWAKLPKKRNVRVYQPFTHPFPRMAHICLFTVTVWLRYVRVNRAPSCMMPCGSRWKNSIWKANDTHTDRGNPEQVERSASPQALAAHACPPPCVSSPYGIVLASPRRLQVMSTTVSSWQQPLHSCHFTSMGHGQTSVFNVGFPS